MPIERGEDVVACHFGLAKDDLRRRGRRLGVAKWVAIDLAVRLTGRRLRDIGQYFGQLTHSSVSMAQARLHQKLRQEGSGLPALLQRLEKRIRGHNK